jgi:hypothetical protein
VSVGAQSWVWNPLTCLVEYVSEKNVKEIEMEMEMEAEIELVLIGNEE